MRLALDPFRLWLPRRCDEGSRFPAAGLYRWRVRATQA
jgi:hypothetical protein